MLIDVNQLYQSSRFTALAFHGGYLVISFLFSHISITWSLGSDVCFLHFCSQNSNKCQGTKKAIFNHPTILFILFQVSEAEGLLKDLAVRSHVHSFTVKVCDSLHFYFFFWGGESPSGLKAAYKPWGYIIQHWMPGKVWPHLIADVNEDKVWVSTAN